MSKINSILSSLAPEASDFIAEIVKKSMEIEQLKKKNINAEVKNKPKNYITGNYNKKSSDDISENNKDIKNNVNPLPQTKDICQQDCICEDIKAKNNIKSNNSLSDVDYNELAKYIIYGGILSTPVCKKNRF